MQIISNYLDTIPNLSSYDKAKLNYFFSCILYEGSKILLFLVFFAMTQHVKGFLYSVLILLPLRIISGGLHFKHYLSCLAFSFAYFYLVTIPLKTIMPCFEATLIILSICILTNYKIGPIISHSRPVLSQEKISQSKFYILIATVYDLILTALFFETQLAPVGFWTIVLHSVQLIIAKFAKK